MSQSILITGCSTGIGFRAAQMLKQRGYRVFATARKPEDVNRLGDDGFESLPLDLDDSASIQTAVEEIMQRCNGKLDAVFHNGAFGLPGALEDQSREGLRAQFETNFFGWIELTNLILPYMRKAKQGRVVFNSSVLGMVSFPYRGPYGASKFALECAADTYRLELADTNIKVVLIEPGPITSKFRANAEAAFHRFVKKPEQSAHAESYLNMQKRLEKKGDHSRFTLPPDAVVEKLIKALEAEKPKLRYYVTFPTHLFGVLRRILPYRILDKALVSASGNGKN